MGPTKPARKLTAPAASAPPRDHRARILALTAACGANTPKVPLPSTIATSNVQRPGFERSRPKKASPRQINTPKQNPNKVPRSPKNTLHISLRAIVCSPSKLVCHSNRMVSRRSCLNCRLFKKADWRRQYNGAPHSARHNTVVRDGALPAGVGQMIMIKPVSVVAGGLADLPAQWFTLPS
jgi:hypothetical protein